MTEDIHIALIDDDPAVLDSLRLYLERRGVLVSCFLAAEDFLATKDKLSFNCVVTDVRMPGLSGIDLVREMAAQGSPVRVILITAHGDVEMAVAAIKLGAFDFIEKPFNEKRLLDSIQRAAALARETDDSCDLRQLRARAESLTGRQREIMDLAVTGLSNKQIALRLRISPRTVESHRAWMMERMQARNLAELVRKVMRLNPHA
jgi:two-component system response regulator FixJ